MTHPMAWLASLILVAGVVDDLRSRKVRNAVAVTCLVLALAASTALSGWLGFGTALIGAIVAFALYLPLVLLKIVGAGDMKLFVAFGAAVSWNASLMVALYSILWGGVFGLIQIIAQGDLMGFLKNMKTLAVRRKSEGIALHRIPFTVAMLLAWFSFLQLEGAV